MTPPLIVLLVLVASFVYIYSYFIVRKRIHILLPSYVRWYKKNRSLNKGKRGAGPIHIMFTVVDHFEPGSNTKIVADWVNGYQIIADKHRDSEGAPVKHTWFYPLERLNENHNHLDLLAQLTSKGYGEIELHLHHRDDTEESLSKKLKEGIRIFNEHGALITTDNEIKFGFVHGDWALDNSIIVKKKNLCGVNSEISILRDLGCYADFTFPALYTDAQPQEINSIYYAIDDPLKPKSYNTGKNVAVNKYENIGDLMIVQGPTTIDFKNWKTYCFLRACSCGVEGRISNAEYAVDEWIKANVHVEGRPNWIFVKTHTHGAIPDRMKTFLGSNIEKIYTYLESTYNDERNYCLHYVTTREAYNIIKAAEAGLTGDPGQYRDFKIKPYQNTALRVEHQ